MHILVHKHIKDIDAGQWNALLGDNNPFMRHEFLLGLEQSACVHADTGWQVCHIAVYCDQAQSTLIGAMPCYLKSHSYGEYIFDWTWADAYYRHGLEYYPKLSNAVPFTPATGKRWLIANSADQSRVLDALLNKVKELAEHYHASSFHSLFLNQQQQHALPERDFLKRVNTQFHWHNQSYTDFDDFLRKMSSKKRKNIKRERRRVHESGVEYQWFTGDKLNQNIMSIMYQFYQHTVRLHGAQGYLNNAFFNYLAQDFGQQTMVLLATFKQQAIAASLFFISNDTLYGRYWGALNHFHSVHFETCYYQAIEWCIEHEYQRFEAGAQGEHKLARGLEPSNTYSAHWIRDSEFKDAIARAIEHETNHIQQYQSVLKQHSPFVKHE